MRRILVLCLAGAAALAGALVAVANLGDGNPAGGPAASAPPAPGSPTPPDQIPPTGPAVTSPASPGPGQTSKSPPGPPSVPEPPGYRPAMVTPRPGMENVHPVIWRRAEVINDRTVRVHFESGVEPCSVLDQVVVDYRPAEVAVSLFEGNDPAFRDAACIMIAQFKAVDVELDQPVDGRAIVEGNQR